MLNKQHHQLLMAQILKDIYTDPMLANSLGFKGGTCGFFFYQLPRFSVDLDFDLLNLESSEKQLILDKLVQILHKYGQLKEQRLKRFTIFLLLSYGDDDRNIKVEINTRQLWSDMTELFNIESYLGVGMRAASQDYLFAGKLMALAQRSRLASRDIFDVHYFCSKQWSIHRELVELNTKESLHSWLLRCADIVAQVDNTHIMQGLSELLQTPEQKSWVKHHLKTDAEFMLRSYAASM